MRPGAIRWTGDYAVWSDAAAAAGGYEAPEILIRTEAALNEVLAGRAAFERDGVAFHDPEARTGLLSSLLLARLLNGRPLRVVDWGGSLASAWLQHRRWLPAGTIQTWGVVEQAAVVIKGNQLLRDDTVSFHTSFADASAGGVDMVLWGASLQYFAEPHYSLHEACASPASYLCLERLATTSRGRDRLTVQHVPRSIYRANYPAWFLDAAALGRSLGTAGLTKILDWSCSDDAGLPETSFIGQLWKRV